jgi:hypothetical protein
MMLPANYALAKLHEVVHQSQQWFTASDEGVGDGVLVPHNTGKWCIRKKRAIALFPVLA